MAEKIILGTRGSELALTQARMVAQALQERWADLEIDTRTIRTSGDEGVSGTEPPELRAGRKGLFTGEIEHALLAEEIDLAVHSAKDLPSELNPATQIAAALPRGPVDDLLVSKLACDLSSLPADAVVATGSARRKHQLHWKRPDLEIVGLRGNIPTRLRKLATQEWNAIVLARAGLERLGLNMSNGGVVFEDRNLSIQLLPREVFLPAGGQGVIAVQIRTDDDRARMLVESINDFDTRLCLRAEREFLRLLHADCNQPIGVLASMAGSAMQIRAQIFDAGAAAPREARVEGPGEDAELLSARLFLAINGQ